MQQSLDPIHAAFAAARPVGVVEAPENQAEAPPPHAHAAGALEVQGAEYPRNDYGNGQRLVLYYGHNFVWVPRLGWFRWDGKRWASDEDEMAVRSDAQGIAARIMHEIPFIAPEIDDKGNDRGAARHATHASNSGNTSKISNMLAEAKTAVAVSVDDLNTDPMMLCCENGVLHFTKRPEDAAEVPSWREPAEVPQVDLLPHDRRHKISKLAKAKYDPKAKCVEWEKFLVKVQPDPEMRAFLKRWFGYSLTGVTTEQKMAFFFGQGRNGKSTAVDLIARILADYSTTLPIESLTGSDQNKGNEATPDLVRLPGARFVRASEPEQGQKMREARIKALTGGEPFPIRRLHQEAVDLVPVFKLTISGNYKPEIRGADDGIWRRVMLVPWEVQIAAADVDALLPQKLWAERAGILRWMVEGCLEWMQGGLRPPEIIDKATLEYRQVSDPMRDFLTTECDITGNSRDWESAKDINQAFNAWMLDSGTGNWTVRYTANQIKDRANNVRGPNGATYSSLKRNTTGYKGILLTQAARIRKDQYATQLHSAK